MSEVRQTQMNKLRQMIKEHNDGGWDFAWYATKYAVWYRRIELTPLSRKSDVTPWDVGSYQPPLKEVLDDKSIGLPTSGRALVPGCGRVRDSTSCHGQGPYFQEKFHRDTTLSASQDPSVWRHLGLIFLKRLLTPPAREWNRGVPQ